MGSLPSIEVVVGPDWNGKAPPGTVEVLRSPTHRVWATARVLMKDRSELPTLLPQISPTSIRIRAGASQQFFAQTSSSNGGGAEVTSQSSWTSSNPAGLTISAGGLANAQAAQVGVIIP